MTHTIRVLKPFILTRAGKTPIPAERRFSVGEHEIDDDTAAHPYIQSLADGCIEHHEVTRARLKAQAKIAQQKADEAAAQQRIAEAAYARACGLTQTTSSPEALQKELNTPVNENQRAQGEDIDPKAAGAKKKG